MNPWTITGVLGAWLLSLAAMGYWQNDAGHTAERVKWQGEQTKELAAANRDIARLNDEARETERQHAASITNIAGAYERKLRDEKRKTDALVNGVLDGSLVLRDPGGVQAGCGGTGEAGAGAGGHPDPAGTGLSAAAARFLLDLTGDCNTVAVRLSACQHVLISDREGYRVGNDHLPYGHGAPCPYPACEGTNEKNGNP